MHTAQIALLVYFENILITSKKHNLKPKSHISLIIHPYVYQPVLKFVVQNHTFENTDFGKILRFYMVIFWPSIEAKCKSLLFVKYH